MSTSDLSVYDSHGNLAVVVEVKSRTGTSQAWAARLRRNLLAHGLLPFGKVFLLVTPERIYGWGPETMQAAEDPPPLVLRTELALGPYLPERSNGAPTLSEPALEMVVASWLGDVARGTQQTTPDSESARQMERVGLPSVILGGRIERQAVA